MKNRIKKRAFTEDVAVFADARIHYERRCTGVMRRVGSNGEQNIGGIDRNRSTQKIPYKRILEI